MAEVDKLTFKLELADEEFRTKIAEAEKTAKELNISLTQYLSLKQKLTDKDSASMSNVTRNIELYNRQIISQQKLNEQIEKTNAAKAKAEKNNAQAEIAKTRLLKIQEKLSDAEKKSAEATEKQNAALSKQSTILSQLTGLATTYFSIYEAKRIVETMTRVSAEFELQRTSLRAILNDANGADAVFNKLKELAVISPFSFKDLVTYSKQLSAYSIPIGELYDTAKMLADLSSGLGVSMDRLILAYGQVRSATVLRGQELRQFTEAGIPILDALAEKFSVLEGRIVKTSEVFDKIPEKGVSFAMVRDILTDMTNEGGKFYDMQRIQSETLQGKLSNLRDAYEIMFSEIGENGFNDFMKGAVDGIRKMISAYEEVGKMISTFIVSLGAARTALLLYQLSVNTANAANIGFVKAFSSIVSFVKTNPYAIIASGVALATTLVYKYATALNESEKMMKSARDASEKYISSVESEESLLRYLISDLEKADKNTQKYADAKRKITTEYSQYIDNIVREKIEIGNLSDAYSILTEKIKGSYREKMFSEGQAEIMQLYNDGLDEIRSTISRITRDSGKDVSQAVFDYIFGRKTWEEIYSDFSSELDRLIKKSSVHTTNTGNAQITTYFGDSRKELGKIRSEYEDLNKYMSDSLNELRRNIDYMSGSGEKSVEKMFSGWQKAAADTLAKFNISEGNAAGLWWEKEDFYDYLNQLKSAYDDVMGRLAVENPFNEGVVQNLERQRDAIVAVMKALHNEKLLYGSSSETTSKKSDKTEEQIQIERTIESLKSLKSAYDSLKEYVSGGSVMEELLKSLFPNVDKSIIDGLRFDDKLISAAERLRKFNEETAESVINSVKKSDVDSMIESLKQMEEWKDYLEKWENSEVLSGTGVGFDLSKISANYKKKLQDIGERKRKLYEEYQKAQIANKGKEELTGITEADIRSAYGGKLIELQKEQWNALAETQKEGSDEAKKFVKEYLENIKGLDLDNFSQQNIAALKRIKKAIRDFSMDDIPEDVKKKFEEAGISIEELLELLREAFGETERKVDHFISDKALDAIIKASNALGSLGGSIAELGAASGNGTIESIGTAIEGISSILSKTSESLKNGGNIAGAVTFFSSIAESIIGALTQSAKLKSSIAEAALEASKLNAELALSTGVNTVFGDNAIQAVRNATAVLSEYGKRTREERNLLSETISWKSGFLNMGRSAKELSVAIRELGYDVFDEYGNLNSEALQKILDTYDTLTTSSRKWIQSAINDAEVYKEAITQIEDTIDSTFGSIADSIAGAFVDSYIQVGDATDALAGEISDTMSGIAVDIAKKIVSAFVIDNVLNQYKEQLMDIYKMMSGDIDKNGLAVALSELSNGIMKDSEIVAEMTNELMRAFENAGISIQGASSDMSDAIGGIKENQADLLASYINAIRADVSSNRNVTEQTKGLIEQIVRLLPSVPTLSDYLSSIQASSHDTAKNTERILAHVESVMTSEDGSPSFKVSM